VELQGWIVAIVLCIVLVLFRERTVCAHLQLLTSSTACLCRPLWCTN